MLRYRPAALVVLALVVSSLALVGLEAPASADPAPLGLKAGDVVISDTGHSRVIVHPADGSADRVLTTDVDVPSGVAVTPTGDVIVADTGNDRVIEIRADGSGITVLKTGAWSVTNVALDSLGHVLFTGNGMGGIGQVTLDGDFIDYFGIEEPGMTGLGVASDGDVIFGNYGVGIYRMEADGSDIRQVDGFPSTTFGFNFTGLAVGPDDLIYATETNDDAVFVGDGVDPATPIGTGLDEPHAVALAQDGTLYVADQSHSRVVAIAPDVARSQTDVVTDSPLLHPAGVAVVPISPEQVGDAFVGTAAGDVVRVRGSETVTIASGLDPISDVVVRDDGEVVVATGDRLVELSGDGSGSSELASFGHPVQALALRPDGDLLAAVDDGSGGTDVQRVAPDGATTQVDASPIYPFTALAVDDLSETYATFEIAPSTSVLVQTSTGTQVPGVIAGVSGLAAEPAGSFLVTGVGSGVRRLSADHAGVVLTHDPAAPGRLALDLDGDALIASAGDDALLRMPAAGATPTPVATIDDPVGVGVYVPRPSVSAVTAFPDTGNVGTAYVGYDFDADDNDGGPVTFRAVGELPPGLDLDASTGELSGTPTTAGDYTFRIAADNHARGTATDELEISVGKRLQSLTFTSTAPAHAFPDDTYTPTVTSDGSGNPVTISIDPGSSAVCSYDAVSGTVTFLTGGLCTILADQAGDADHEDASTAHQDVYVDKVAQTATFTSTAPTGAKVGDTYTPTATGGPSANDVTFEITGNPLPPTFMTYPCSYDSVTGEVTFEHPGTCRLTATKEGDDRYWPGTRSQNITVGKGQLRFISTKPAPGRVGGTYTPAVNAPDAYFWIDEGDGDVCSYDYGTGEVSLLTPGDCEVVAEIYTDDYTSGSVRETITVAKQAQEITFTTLPPASAPIGGSYAPEATGGASGNPVTFSIADESDGVCSLDSGVVHLDHAGTCVLQADQAGDSTYEPAEPATQTIVVARDPGSVTVTSPPATGVVGQRYTVTATASGPGSVEAAVTSPAVCHTDGDDVVLDHAGTCHVAVSWAGDADHEPASSGQTIVVSPAPTVVELDVRGRAIVATVNVVAPGAGRPTGAVEFSDGATVLGTAELDQAGDGVMTAVLARDRTLIGGQHQINARYVGSDDYAESQAMVAWVDPAITYTVASAAEPSATGWYHAPVTVTFQCTAGTAPLLDPCPAPLTFTKNRRAGRTVVRDIVARDGTTASVAVTGIRIDLAGPKLRVRGAQPGHTYAAPRKLYCVARDHWSGVDTCVLKTKRKQGGHVVSYRAVALDRAGNKTVVRGKYRVR